MASFELPVVGGGKGAGQANESPRGSEDRPAPRPETPPTSAEPSSSGPALLLLQASPPTPLAPSPSLPSPPASAPQLEGRAEGDAPSLPSPLPLTMPPPGSGLGLVFGPAPTPKRRPPLPPTSKVRVYGREKESKESPGRALEVSGTSRLPPYLSLHCPTRAQTPPPRAPSLQLHHNPAFVGLGGEEVASASPGQEEGASPGEAAGEESR